ncbi:periplasmic nitrate reductase, NapE protein [Cribrihabitans sp. XS_ASV171]
MSGRQATEPDSPHGGTTRRRELVQFLILAFGVWPVVAVGVVGGYGFLVWMYQLIAGPPGPPGH